MVPLPESRDVDIHHKSKVAVAKKLHILRLYGWRKAISNTQWANISVHELNENKNDNMEHVDARDN